MIDAPNEPTITPAEVGKRLGKSTRTVLHWIHVGVLVPGREERVKLEAVKVGGRCKTAEWAVDRFMAAINAKAALPSEPPKLTKAEIARRARVDAELKARRY